MNKRDALRLKARDRILFCDSKWTQKATQWWRGEVLFVTDNGGVRVRITEGRKPGGFDGPGTGPNVGEERWVVYSHIVEKERW